MTKPAVWVQFTVKKNRVDDKNLLHLKYLTCQKLQLFFSVLRKISFTDCFVLSLNLDQYAARLNSVHTMTKVMILNKKNLEKKFGSWFTWLPIRNISREPNVGPHVSLTLGLQQFYLTEENLKMSYNLKVLPMKALEARSDTEWFGWIQS